MPRTLPVELIHHVLADNSLDHADLARCCRVSQSFLTRARPHLYAAKNYLLDEDNKLSRRTQAWCATVRASRATASLVRRLRFTGTCVYEYLPSRPGGRARRSIEALVKRCPNLEHVSTPDEPLDKIFDLRILIGANLRTLVAVNFDDLAYELFLHLPNLKHLGLVLNIRKLARAYPEQGDQWASTLGATLANSYTSIRSLKYVGAKNDLIALDAFPALDTLCIGMCADDDIVKILGGSRRIESFSVEQHQPLFPDPLGTGTCRRALRALPPSVRAYHVFQFPTVDNLTRLLAALPDDVHLDELGVAPGTYGLEPACPRFPVRAWTDRWHAQKEQWDALDAACAAEGVKLVLPRDLFLPAEARAPDEPGGDGQW